MFDGFEIYQSTTSQAEFEANPNLSFKSLIDERSGEMSDTKVAERKGIKIICIKGRRPRIKGSITKWHNQGVHNYNNITPQQVANAINEIAKELGIDPKKEIITMLEVGTCVSLNPPTLGDTVISSALSLKGVPYRRAIDNKWYCQSEHANYIGKTYNKGLQYNMPIEIVRHEVKGTSMRYFWAKGIKIHTLEDLKNSDNYPAIGKLVYSSFEDIIFRDPSVDVDRLTPGDKELYFKGSERSYWSALSVADFKSKAAYNAKRKKREREESRFRKLNDPSFRREILEKIKNLWEEFIKSAIHDMSQIHSRHVANSNKVKNIGMSQISTLNVVAKSDNHESDQQLKESQPRDKKESQDQKKEVQERSKKETSPEAAKTVTIFKPVPQIKRRSAIATKNKATFNVDLNSKSNKDGLYSVFIRITENRKSVRIMMDFRIAKDHFSKENGSWISPLNLKSEMFNREIEKWIEELKNRYDDLSGTHDNPLAFIKCKVEEATVGNYLNDYLVRIHEVCEPGYYKKLKSVFGQFIAFLSPDYPLNQVEAMDIHQFRRWRLAEGDVEATIANKLKNIHTVFTIALSEELIIRDPFPKISQSKYLNRVRQIG